MTQSDRMIKAAFDDDADEVRRLVAAGVPIGSDPRRGNHPLRVAAQGERCNALRALLECGADPNERITRTSPVDKRVEEAFTPLMFAGSPAAIDVLVAYGADVNAISASGLSPLMRVAHSGLAELVEALLRHGADPSLRQTSRKGGPGRSALDFAVRSLASWEGVYAKHPTPEAAQLLAEHRRAVQLLSQASAA